MNWGKQIFNVVLFVLDCEIVFPTGNLHLRVMAPINFSLTCQSFQLMRKNFGVFKLLDPHCNHLRWPNFESFMQLGLKYPFGPTLLLFTRDWLLSLSFAYGLTVSILLFQREPFWDNCKIAVFFDNSALLLALGLHHAEHFSNFGEPQNLPGGLTRVSKFRVAGQQILVCDGDGVGGVRLPLLDVQQVGNFSLIAPVDLGEKRIRIAASRVIPPDFVD